MKKRMDKYKYLDEVYEAEEDLNFLFDRDFKTKKQYIDIKDIEYYNKYENFTKEENNKYNFKISKNNALKISLKDNHPKYVLSLDKTDLSQNGIIHKNIIDWLLEKNK